MCMQMFCISHNLAAIPETCNVSLCNCVADRRHSLAVWQDEGTETSFCLHHLRVREHGGICCSTATSNYWRQRGGFGLIVTLVVSDQPSLLVYCIESHCAILSLSVLFYRFNKWCYCFKQNWLIPLLRHYSPCAEQMFYLLAFVPLFSLVLAFPTKIVRSRVTKLASFTFPKQCFKVLGIVRTLHSE